MLLPQLHDARHVLDVLGELGTLAWLWGVGRKVAEWLIERLTVLLALLFAPLILPAIYESLSTWIRRALPALTVAGTLAALIVLIYRCRANLASRPLPAIPRA